MAKRPPLAQEQLPDGVYLGLEEEIYFAQDRLGTSDLISLDKNREGWWWKSRHNPRASDEGSDEQNYGSALHAIMLEGLSAYEDRFAVAPDKRDFEGLILSGADAEEAIREAGFDLRNQDPPVSKWKAHHWLHACRENLPHRPIWDDIMADFRATLERPDGKARKSINPDEDEMLRCMYEAALEHPKVAELLGMNTSWPKLAEVSVLFTDRRGLKRRNRYDLMPPLFTVDLKTLGNWQGQNLDFHVPRLIRDNRHHIQLADEHASRKWLMRLLATEGEKKLVGGLPTQREWMMRIVAEARPWEWWWLYYQKPDAKAGRAPVLYPLNDDWASYYHKEGHRAAERAADLYVACVEHFGFGRPWSRVEEPRFTNIDYAKSVQGRFVMPADTYESPAVPGEEDALEPFAA